MTTQLMPFQFHSHEVRTVIRDGDPWFVLSDVARALQYRDAANAGRCLSDSQKADTRIVSASTSGTEQARTVTIINEFGLYRLVLRSRKPEAVAFSDWVTGEVLPAIRKTGGYGRQLDLLDHDAIKSAREAYCGWAWEAHKRMRDAGIEFPSVPEGVEQAALEAALADAMMTARFMLTFDDDYRMQIKPVPRDCVVMSLEGVAKYLADPSAMPRREAVSAIAQAAVGRLARM